MTEYRDGLNYDNLNRGQFNGGAPLVTTAADGAVVAFYVDGSSRILHPAPLKPIGYDAFGAPLYEHQLPAEGLE